MPTSSEAEIADLNAWRKMRRAELIQRRTAISKEQQRLANTRIGDFLLEGFPLLAGLVLGCYWPFKGEVDPRIAMLRLRERGTRTALPVVAAKGIPLEFRDWYPGVDSDPGVFGLPVPRTTKLTPDAVLMPPVGFDASGYRLGYGGGYFDRTLASLPCRPLAIGLAHEIARMQTVHPQEWDIPMDFVITEAGIHQAHDGILQQMNPPEADQAARSLRIARLASMRAQGAR